MPLLATASHNETNNNIKINHAILTKEVCENPKNLEYLYLYVDKICEGEDIITNFDIENNYMPIILDFRINRLNNKQKELLYKYIKNKNTISNDRKIFLDYLSKRVLLHIKAN